MEGPEARTETSSRTLEAALVVLAGCCFAAAFTWPLITHLGMATMATSDWDQHLEYAYASWDAVAHFRQMPHWDPYKCGGVPLLADPQVRVLTPFFLLHLLFGVFAGVRLEAILHVVIGWTGGYYLGRQLKLGIIPSIVCASLFPSSSWMFLHFAEGHFVFMSLEYLPWILTMWLCALNTDAVLPIAIGGLISAIAFSESGIYVVYLTIPFMFAVGLTFTLQRRSIKPLAALVAMAVFAAGFGAVKLLPVLALGISRGTDSTEWMTASLLAKVLFSRDQNHNRYILGMYWGFHEYGAYVEPLFAGLALLGAMRSFRRAVPWLAGAFVTLVLSIGSPVWWAPWALLHQLPIYSFEHAPTRFLIPFVMALAPVAGLGAQAITDWHPSWTRPAILILLAAAIADAAAVSNPNLWISLQSQPAERERLAQFRQFHEPTERDMFSIARSNQGALICYANNTLGIHASGYNDPRYRGEQYLMSHGSVKLRRWTPNVLSYDVEVPEASTLVVNQNFDPGWMIVQGDGQLFDYGGLIGVELPQGSQRLRLAYRTRGFRLGFAITMLTVLATLWLMLGEGLRAWVLELGSRLRQRSS